MLYAIRVNSSLAKLGIPPALIETSFRRELQQVGQASGNTPQEVAVFIAAQLPLMHRFDLRPAVIEKWVREKKINHQKDEMRDALSTLCLWNLLSLP